MFLNNKDGNNNIVTVYKLTAILGIVYNYYVQKRVPCAVLCVLEIM